MTSIITSIKDLIASIFEVIFSVVKSTLGTVYDLLMAFVDFFAGIPKMLLHTVKGSLETAGGIGTFITSNIVVIAIIALGGYGYLAYQRREGRPVHAGTKKLN
jgi:phage-related protein